jgi:hypothetical protein
MTILSKIFLLLTKIKNNIWIPFKNWFYVGITSYGTWEYRGAIDMQEYLPMEAVQIKITKFQSFLLWLSDLKIFKTITFYWDLLNSFFGFAKYLVIFLIFAIIFHYIFKFFTFLHNRYWPKKLENEKKGLEFLTSLVKHEKQLFESEKNKTFPNKYLEQEKIIFELKNQNANLISIINKNIKHHEK